MTKVGEMQLVTQSKSYLVKENYHQKNSEVGYFHSTNNKLLEIMGLKQNQEVDSETHISLIDGINSANKEALANNSGKDNRRGGFDVTTSAPKSFSLLTEIARASNNKELEDYLNNIQIEANIRMMQEANKYAMTRLSDEARTRISGVDMLWGSFRHDTTRVTNDGFIDPQEHIHNFVYNLVGYTDENGNYKIASFENKKMMQMQKYLGNFYRNEFAKLLKENGFELELKDAKDGTFEISGFTKEQLDSFSNRGKEIRKLADDLIKSGEVNPNTNLQKIIEIARLQNYKAKTKIDRDELTKDNAKRLELADVTESQIFKILTLEKKNFPTQEFKEEIFKKSYEFLVESKGIFTAEDLKMQFAKLTVHYGISLNEVDEMLAKNTEIVKLKENKFTTKTMIELEKNIIFDCLNSKNFTIDTDDKKLNDYLEKNQIVFTQGQKEACELVLKTESQFVAVQGDAGSGKTFSLGVLKKVYENDFDFVGLAPTGKASENIGKDANVQYKTIDSYILNEIKRTGKPRIILLDETGMVDSIKLSKLLESAKKNGDKVVLIGDTKQYASIGAGKIFEDLQKYGIETAFVTENKRQETEELRKVVENIKEKNVEEAIKNLEKNVIEKKREKTLFQEILKHYDEKSVILAPMNKQRNALNLLVREKRKQNKNLDESEKIEISVFTNAKSNSIEKFSAKSYKIGQILTIDSIDLKGFKAGQKFLIKDIKDDNTLIIDTISTNKTGRDRTRKNIEFNIKDNIDKVSIFEFDESKKMEFCKNEKIIFTKKIKDGKTTIQNGATGTITSIDRDNIHITLDSKNKVVVNIKENPFLDYAYAITDYKSQGMSIDKVLVLGDKMMSNLNAFYVQVTRAKKDLKFFTTDLDAFVDKAKSQQMKESTLDYSMREEFKELEKNNYKKWKFDALEFIKKDRKDIKNLILNKGQKNGTDIKRTTKNESKDRVDRITEHSSNRFDVGARQNINKLISAVSVSLRRAISRWRKSTHRNIKENWRRYLENRSSFGAFAKIEALQELNKIDKNKVLKDEILKALGIANADSPILSILNKTYAKEKLLQNQLIDLILRTKEDLKTKQELVSVDEVKTDKIEDLAKKSENISKKDNFVKKENSPVAPVEQEQKEKIKKDSKRKSKKDRK
ncbi:relaxase domain-containing protein [Aliarcobacter butzleri]|uniref:MobF family relaxase n=1 Tax=Aliarcobacter butzleri TaxID=28197 RepID=UPI0021B18358|nr:MobF family relaxase [Aliarcobacter butzleri]MCT7604575.1 relaxase domain-containing protein [Aliarcobacter butzleri]